jgi:hypothetical protein
MSRRTLFAFVAAGLFVGAQASAPARASDVGPNTNATYVRECGACHFPYQPGFLPARSWRRLMETMANHFGENAEVKVADREAIATYLSTGAADFAGNSRSREVMASLSESDLPLRVTGVLYVGGIHGGFLDPKFRGMPAVKTLADCAACHPRAQDGRFGPRNYIVSDEAFRVLSGD